MTKFSDQLFDDLMQEHGHTLASARVKAAPRRHPAVRPVLLTAGAGGLAVAVTVGTLVAGGGSPAYAVTSHPDGTVTLAVYQQSGIDQANAKLRRLGENRVVVVPVRAGCPSINSLPGPGKPGGKLSGSVKTSTGGGVTVNARGIPAGDILVVGLTPAISSPTMSSVRLTSGKVPRCVSIPKQPSGGAPGQGTGIGTGGKRGPAGGSGTATRTKPGTPTGTGKG